MSNSSEPLVEFAIRKMVTQGIGSYLARFCLCDRPKERSAEVVLKKNAEFEQM